MHQRAASVYLGLNSTTSFAAEPTNTFVWKVIIYDSDFSTSGPKVGTIPENWPMPWLLMSRQHNGAWHHKVLYRLCRIQSFLFAIGQVPNFSCHNNTKWWLKLKHILLSPHTRKIFVNYSYVKRSCCCICLLWKLIDMDAIMNPLISE